MNDSPAKSIAMIGSGYWGKNLVRNFHALGVLGMVCDTDPEVVRGFIERLPEVKGVSSFAEVLQHPEIRGVAIATPAGTHAELVRQALLSDKDVYVEKPLCLSEGEAMELTRLATARQRILMVGHLLWYHPAVLKLAEMIQAGELGRIQYIYSNRLNLGKLRREENVLWSFAPHDVSVVLGLLKEMPVSIQAQGGNFLHERIADTTVTLLNFASGVRAHIFVSWLHPFKEQKLVVVGEKGMVVFDDTAPWSDKLIFYPHSIAWSGSIPTANKAAGHKVVLTEAEPLAAECQHFLDCVAGRRQPRTDGAEGIRVLRVLNACQTALEQGGTIRLDHVPPPHHVEQDWFAHASAQVDAGVEIGRGTKIWHFSHIMQGSKLGESCNIGQNVVVGPDAVVGNGCKIQNNVSIYTGVTLEDHVFCGPSMVFTNVMTPRAHISRKHEYLPTLVRQGSTIGANATIVCGHTLGRYSFIGAGAVVTRDVPDHALMVGNPARRIGWMCQCGVRLDQALHCPACGLDYRPHPDGGLEALQG